MKKNVVPRIKPSKRPKKRYILFFVKAQKRLEFFFVKKFFDTFFHGFFGASEKEKMARLVLFDTRFSFGIVKCRHLFVKEVKDALLSIKKIGSVQVDALPVLVSGSIKKLKLAMQKKAKQNA